MPGERDRWGDSGNLVGQVLGSFRLRVVSGLHSNSPLKNLRA